MNTINWKTTILLITVLVAGHRSIAQEYLSVEDAIQLALDQNYEIQAAENNKKIAENNTSLFNTGKLPTLNASAGVAYDFNRSVNKTDGQVFKNNTNGFPLNAGVNINYVVYDAGRKLNVEQLDEFVDRSELQLRYSRELLLTNLMISYFNVAQLEKNANVQRENLEISKRNLQRAEYALEYGLITELGILNNEVNLNRDSVNLRVALVEFENAKRDLNILLGRSASIDFTTDTTITFMADMTLDQLLADALDNNILIQLADRDISIDQLNIDLAKSGWMPTVNANAGYNWRQQFNPNPPVLNIGTNEFPGASSSGANGFNTGLSLSWNIFDGGRTKMAVQNSMIAVENRKLYRDDLTRQIERDVLNNWEAYQNARVLMETILKNIETSESNFERTAEKYRLGNLTITALREAQTNLLNTRLSYLQAVYQAKVLEVQLLQLAGKLTE